MYVYPYVYENMCICSYMYTYVYTHMYMYVWLYAYILCIHHSIFFKGEAQASRLFCALASQAGRAVKAAAAAVWNDAFCNPIAQFATLMQRPAYYLTFALDGTAAAIKRFFDKRKKNCWMAGAGLFSSENDDE